MLWVIYCKCFTSPSSVINQSMRLKGHWMLCLKAVVPTARRHIQDAADATTSWDILGRPKRTNGRSSQFGSSRTRLSFFLYARDPCQGSLPVSPSLTHLFLQAGDIEQNPGPLRYICPCFGNSYRGSVQYRSCRLWFHLKSINITYFRATQALWNCQNCPPSPSPAPAPTPTPTPSCEEKKLKILQRNSTGIQNKMMKLKGYIKRVKPHVICFQEFKLHSF